MTSQQNRGYRLVIKKYLAFPATNHPHKEFDPSVELLPAQDFIFILSKKNQENAVVKRF